MACKTITIGAVAGDKYYDCVDGKCVEKAGGAYKNDATCAGKCPADDTMTYILLGAVALGLLYFMTERK